jgi:hypothetical protein
MIQNTAEELAWLVQETERLVRNVEDIRVRIASGCKRRAGSQDARGSSHDLRGSSHDLRGGSHEGEGVEAREGAPEPLGRTTPVTERPSSAPTSERPSAPGLDRAADRAAPAHVSLSRWLPPLSPPRKLSDSGEFAVVDEDTTRPPPPATRPVPPHPTPAQSGPHPVAGHFTTSSDDAPPLSPPRPKLHG